MRKKDEELRQFESALRELRLGEEESATTTFGEQRIGNPNISGVLFKFIFKFWKVRIIIIALLLIIVAAGVIWLFSGSTFKKESTRSGTRNSKACHC